MVFNAAGRFVAATLVIFALPAGAAMAAQCGNDKAGFEDWKAEFRQEAAANGVGQDALRALERTSYASKTIAADRGQKSFKLSLDRFMEIRGGKVIAAQGKSRKKKDAELFARIEERFGVPAGPLIAIWGMETGFGNFLGNQNILSSVATLAYDCRRSEFFTRHLYGALKLVQDGSLSANAVGAAHGEIGQTQFLPANVVLYGVDGNGDGRVDMIGSKADALASTASFLRAHGWKRGAGYQPGEPNFAAIRGWNAASVYQEAIAIIAAEIDGG